MNDTNQRKTQKAKKSQLRKNYCPPVVTIIGTVAELTAGKSNQTSDSGAGYKK